MQIPIHAIYMQLADASRMPEMAFVRCEFGNKHCKTIIAHVLITDGQVQETGDFERDGVTFPTTEVWIDFINPVNSDGDMFPTGKLIDILTVPNVDEFEANLINAGMPTIFICASDL